MFEFKVDDMTCSHCAGVITRAIRSLDADAKVEVDLPGHKVRVESSQSRAALARALADAGYPPAD